MWFPLSPYSILMMIHEVFKSLNLKGLGFFCVYWYLLYLLQPRSSRKYRWGYNPFFPNYTQKKKTQSADKKGMDLEVPPSGGMHWRMKFRFNAKENICSMGHIQKPYWFRPPALFSKWFPDEKAVQFKA